MLINVSDMTENTVFHAFSTMNEWIDMMIEVEPKDYDKAKEITDKALDDWYDVEEDMTVFEYVQMKLYENDINASIYVYNE